MQALTTHVANDIVYTQILVTMENTDLFLKSQMRCMQHQSLKKQRHEFTLAQQRVEGHLVWLQHQFDKSSGPYVATSPFREISRGLQGLRGLVGITAR